MKNYKTTDLKFFNNTFSNYDKKIRDLDIDENVFHNYNQLKKNGSRLYLYELGYKRAFAYLKTCSYAKKCDYIQENLFFDRKYTTMYPKSCILGPEEDKQFVKKCKNIGDISFDEASKESENIKNLSRLPPEYIKEEWLKLNLNSKVEMLRIDNCYWLSQDFLSKIGRLDQNLKELSLRNLEINNMIITNVVRWAKELEVLDISNCKGLSIGVCENIQKCCRNLKSLKLARLNEIITNGGLEKISLIPKLEELDISFCSQITNQGLIFLAKNKKHVLTSFDVTGLFKITNESLGQVIAQNNDTLIRIRAALLVQKGIDGDICNEIAKCKSLTNLDISGCVNIDFNNLNSLLNLRKLENLNFSGIPEVDDDLAINLVSSNRGLRILRLSNCTRISSNFLDYLINISNQLLVLEINRTPKIPEAKIEETVHKKSPNLRIIRATNLEWDMKNIGYKIPLPMKEINIEESQAKQDKNPVNQLKKLIEQNRPKRIWEILK